MLTSHMLENFKQCSKYFSENITLLLSMFGVNVLLNFVTLPVIVFTHITLYFILPFNSILVACFHLTFTVSCKSLDFDLFFVEKSFVLQNFGWLTWHRRLKVVNNHYSKTSDTGSVKYRLNILQCG